MPAAPYNHLPEQGDDAAGGHCCACAKSEDGVELSAVLLSTAFSVYEVNRPGDVLNAAEATLLAFFGGDKKPDISKLPKF